MVERGKGDRKSGPRSGKTFSVRGPASSYLRAMFVGSFFSAMAYYFGMPLPGSVLLAASLILAPAFAFTDRIVFDGKRLYRSGVLPKAWAYLTGSRFWIRLRDVEQVETTAFPTLKRAGRFYFRYRTFVRGNGIEFSFASISGGYREMVRSFLASVPEEVLDAASIELRDYLEDPKRAKTRAEQCSIPSPDVLEHAFRLSRTHAGKSPSQKPAVASDEKASGLRLLGNQLRLSGSLLQALESFRRAASIRPDDPWLLFDFARCLQQFAGAEGNPRLERKAAAMMRLAERRAGNDGELLARLGEGYFQLGEWGRAGIAFRKAVDAVGEQFRSIRGMAEIALRDGKLAHVVHNFSSAARFAQSPAARRWSRAEADYFSRLNNDDEYMEMELGRVNLLDTLDRWRGPTFRLCMVGLPMIVLGSYFDDPTSANCGWILSAGTLLLWMGILLGTRVFSPRIAPELLEDD